MTGKQAETPGVSAPGDTGDTPRVAFFSSGWVAGGKIQLGASDYWRVALPAAELLDHGWDVIFAVNLAADDDGTLHVQDPAGRWHGDRDVIVWQRWMGEGAAEHVLRAREAGQVVINDVDDHYWALPGEHYALEGTDPELHPLFNREHYRETVAASSLVTVATDWLAQELGSWGPPVRLVRNYVSLDNWPSPWAPGAHVGWVGAMPWRGNDLELLRETVIPWLRERNLFFYHGGQIHGTRTATEILGYERVSTRPGCSVWEYPQLWDPLRVALVPIEDSPFGRAKSWVKSLEACARGIPFIASEHAETRELGVGRIVERPEDWVRHLEELQDPEVYANECEANRARAEELTISRNWTEWDALLREAAKLGDASGRKTETPTRLATARHMDIRLEDDLQAALSEIPSATTLNERKLALHFATTLWDGKGDVFENGPLLGGATRALGLGMLANEHRDHDALLHTFDWFSMKEDNPLDVNEESFEQLLAAGRLTTEELEAARAEGTFLPLFEALHRDSAYWPLVRPHVGYLPGHRGDTAEGVSTFSPLSEHRYSLLYIDGCKSWYGTKFWLREVCPYVSADAHLLFQDFGQYTCFWLPMLVGRLQEFFHLTAYCDYTYAFRLVEPLTPEIVEERFPDEPEDLGLAEYDRVFDFLHAHAEYRVDLWAAAALGAQRAAAYAYLGFEDEAREILDGLLDRTELVPFRGYLQAARRSPTYRPDGEPILLAR